MPTSPKRDQMDALAAYWQSKASPNDQEPQHGGRRLRPGGQPIGKECGSADMLSKLQIQSPMWDRSGMTHHRLAIRPSLTHYDVNVSPTLSQAVIPFLGA
jgi:hypothetical protein